jgi:hypothetical protein
MIVTDGLMLDVVLLFSREDFVGKREGIRFEGIKRLNVSGFMRVSWLK